MKKLLAIILASMFLYAGECLAMEIHSATFKNNAFLALEQANARAGGADVSPDLQWQGIPAKAKSLALILHDPDAPHEHGWYHWIVVDIPATVSGFAKGEKPSGGARELSGDADVIGYQGPCPPVGHGVHHYNFTIYALADKPDLAAGMQPHEVEAVIKKNAIAQATMTGLYERK